MASSKDYNSQQPIRCLVIQLGVRDHLRHDLQVGQLRRRHALSEQDQPCRRGTPDALSQPLDTTGERRHGDRGLDEPKVSRLGREDQIARERELKAPAIRGALDHRHGGDRQQLDGAERGVHPGGERAKCVRRRIWPLADVATETEVRAVAAHQQDADVAGRRLSDRVGQVEHHLVADPVLRRVVQDDRAHGPFTLKTDLRHLLLLGCGNGVGCTSHRSDSSFASVRP